MARRALFRRFLRKWWRSLEGGTQCHILTFSKNCHLLKKANYKQRDGKEKSVFKTGSLNLIIFFRK